MNTDLRERAEHVLGYTFQEPRSAQGIAHPRLDRRHPLAQQRADGVPRRRRARPDRLRGALPAFPELLEGDLTKIKSAVVSRRTCAEVAQGNGAGRPADHRQGHQLARAMPSSLAAAVYESIVAAIYLDGGFDVVKEYVLRTMTPKIDSISANTHQQNYKAVLQQHAQKILGATPMYELLDEKGPDHSKCFEVCVTASTAGASPALGPEQEDGRAEGRRCWRWKSSACWIRRKWTRRSSRSRSMPKKPPPSDLVQR